MSHVVAIGEEQLLVGYALAGVAVLPARNAAEARSAWESVPAGTTLVLLTPSVHETLEEAVRERQLLWAVVPA
jgi:vacuolar-type H+-ATPase subunit F/Vma7